MEQTSTIEAPPAPAPAPPADWTSVAGRAPGLVGVCGRILLQVGGANVGVLQIEQNGDVKIVEGDEATTVCMADTEETLLTMLDGDHAPLVAILQGRLRTEGDHAFALRVMFGLRAGSPWHKAAAGSRPQ
jgi:hypothetical protein